MKKVIMLLLVLLLLSGCGKQKLEISGDNLASETVSEPTQETKSADDKPVAGEQATQPETAQPQQSEVPTEQKQTEAAQEPTAAVKKSESKGNGRYVFGMILLLLLSGAGLYFSFVIPKRIAERKRRAKARQNARRSQPQEPQRRTPEQPFEMPEQPTFKDGHWV